MIHKRTQTTRSRRLYTAWIPCGEVPLEVGALMSLEKSHLQAYWERAQFGHLPDSQLSFTTRAQFEFRKV